MPPLPEDHIADYVVERTTTDKLQETLNGMAEYYDDLSPVFTGGRDWVVVGSRGAADRDEPTPYGNASKESRGERIQRVP